MNSVAEKAKLVAKQMVAERAKVDLFYLCKYVLGYGEIMDPKVHGPLCRNLRVLLFYKEPGKAFTYEFPSDFGVDEKPGIPMEDQLPTEAQKAEFWEWEDQFEPQIDELHSVSDKLQDDLTSLLALMPRGTLKSSIITIAFSIQWLLNYGDDRVLIDSETFTKSKAFLTEIKGHYEGNEFFREIFYTIYGIYPDQKKTTVQKGTDTWSTETIVLANRTRKRKEPSVDCAGIDVTKNGMHYDLVIMDDLHSEKNTRNAEQIEQVKEHYRLVYSLLEPGHPAVVVGTRWDYNDLYQMIIDEEQEDFNFITRSAESGDGAIFYPGRLSEKELDKFRRKQGPYIYSCNPGDAPILMADWTTKRLEDVRVGDEIIGFEIGVGESKNKLVKTTVLEVNSRVADTQRVTLESGREIRCTPDHQWYTGKNDITHRQYKPVDVGSKMLEVVNTDVDGKVDRVAYGYLAGMIDGEGACKYGSISIHQSPTHNPAVFSKIRSTLDRLELPYTEREECFTINGGRQSKFDILKYSDVAKKHQIVETLWGRPGRAARSKDRVVNIEPSGREKVYALTTSTGNYVCWGYMSKNCQYLNNPVDNENATFKKSMFNYIPVDQLANKSINWYGLVDPSWKGESSDYAVIIIGGMDDRGEIYCRFIWRDKATYGEIVKKMFEIDKMFGPRQWLLETVATQKSIQYFLEQEQRRQMKPLRVKEIRGIRAQKEERIMGLATYYELGRAHHVKGCPNLDILEGELMRFPKSKYDDVSDCFAGLLEIAQPARGVVLSKEKAESRKAYFRKLNKPRSPMIGY